MANPPFLGLRKVVEPPPATAPLHGLVTSVRDVSDREPDNRWEGGFGFLPETCMHVYAWSPACAASGGKPGAGAKHAPDDPSEPVGELPFTLYTTFRCVTAGAPSRDDIGRVTRALEAGTSKGLESEFWSDTLGLGNFSLVNSTPNHAADATGGILNPGGATPTSVERHLGLALLSQGRADCALGSRGVIHAPVALVELWGMYGYLEKDGRALVTKVRGDIVVAGSGYPGTGPAGQPPTPAGKVWAYATGMVEVRLSTVEIVPDREAWAIDHRLNQIAYLAERTVAADTDGCCPHAVLIDLV